MSLAAELRPDPVGELTVLPSPPSCLGEGRPPEREGEWGGEREEGRGREKGEGEESKRRGNEGSGREGKGRECAPPILPVPPPQPLLNSWRRPCNNTQLCRVRSFCVTDCTN